MHARFTQFVVNDLQVLFLAGGGIMQNQTEAVRKRNAFIGAVLPVHFRFQRIVPVAPCFFQQMPAVRGCIDQHIVRLGRNASVNGRFQVFITGLPFVKGKVIKKQNELFTANLIQLFQHRRHQFQLIPADLDEPESVGGKHGSQSFHAGRLSGSPRTSQ